jgi:hypothetical protein
VTGLPQTRPYGYHQGEALGVCQRCGNTRFVSELRLEWTGLRVCTKTKGANGCWDPRPPQTTPPNVWAEGVPVPGASPRPPPVFIDPENGITPEDLEQTGGI